MFDLTTINVLRFPEGLKNIETNLVLPVLK